MSDGFPESGHLDRFDSLLCLLEEDWHSYDALVDATGRPERTLRRDMERLESQGFTLQSKWDGRKKVFRLKPGSRRRPIQPGILDVIAVNLGRGVLGFLEGTELSRQMEVLFQQLRQSSRASERQLRDLDRKFWFMADAPRDYQGCDEQLNEVITCLLDQRVVIFHYRSRRGPLEILRVRPYTLIVRRECLYLLGGVEVSEGVVAGEPRLFDLTRLESCKRLRLSFELPTEWDPSRIFRDSFGVFIPREGEEPPQQVQIWFEQSVGRTIQRRQWHHSQRWTLSPGGGWILELRVRVCPELVHWLLGFGPTARVLAPRSLLELVRTELRQAVELYDRPAPATPLPPRAP